MLKKFLEGKASLSEARCASTHLCILGCLEEAKLLHCDFDSECGVRMSGEIYPGSKASDI